MSETNDYGFARALNKLYPRPASPGPTGTAGEPSERAGVIAGLDALAAEDRHGGAVGETCRKAAALLRAAAAGGTAGEPSEEAKTMAAIIRAAYFPAAAGAAPGDRPDLDAAVEELNRQMDAKLVGGMPPASPAVREAAACIRVGGCLKRFGMGCLCDHDAKVCVCPEHAWYRAHPTEYAAALAAEGERPA